MTELLKSAVLLLLSQQCFDEYFVKYNFLNFECFKATTSKGLGLVIIAGSLTVKVPQILKITNGKSGQGINLFSVILDLFAMTSNLSYSYVKGFPFSAWGEGLFLAIQTATIALLVLHYNGKTTVAAAFAAIYSSVLYILAGGITPVDFLWGMQVLNVPIIIAGKGLQALSNFNNKSTGQLSAATCWMLFLGSFARIFTSLQETGDTTVILTFVIASTLNGIIAAQGLQALSNFNNKSTGQLSAATCWMLFLGSFARIFTSLQETGDTTVILTFVIASTLNGIIAAQVLYYKDSTTKKLKKN